MTKNHPKNPPGSYLFCGARFSAKSSNMGPQLGPRGWGRKPQMAPFWHFARPGGPSGPPLATGWPRGWSRTSFFDDFGLIFVTFRPHFRHFPPIFAGIQTGVLVKLSGAVSVRALGKQKKTRALPPRSAGPRGARAGLGLSYTGRYSTRAQHTTRGGGDGRRQLDKHILFCNESGSTPIKTYNFAVILVQNL